MDNIQPGQMIGAYRIVSQIGQGGMATVYKAYHAAMNRYVAIKVLPRQFAESQEFLGRFQQEARTIANLEHPHILPVYDYGESEGITYFVMRFLDTGTLKDRIKSGPMSISETDRLFTQLAEALGYAHERGVIHRDIKPSNVLVDSRGGVFLTDFGIAKLTEGAAQFTATGTITGTPAYMSPEQAQGDKLDQRTDIYSLGIVLYEMITGRVPFEAETPLAVILKQLQAPLPPPSSVIPDISSEIERVLLKALSKSREDRYPTCGEFLEAWKTALSASDTVRSSKLAVSPEATMAAPPPVVAASKAEPGAKKEAAKQGKFPLIPILAGAVLVPVVCLLAAIIVPRVIKSSPDQTATAQAGLSAQSAQTPGATTLPPIPKDTPTQAVSPGAASWTSWTSANVLSTIAIYGDEVYVGGRNGSTSSGSLTVWNRQDGSILRQYNTASGLPNADVNVIYVDNDNNLWVGTDDGLGFYNGSDWRAYSVNDGLDSTTISAIAPYGDKLLVGTQYAGQDGSGLNVFDGQQWSRFPDFPSSSPDTAPDKLSYFVNAIYQDANGLLWVGTSNGLGRYDGQTWTRFTTADGLPDNNISIITSGDDGTLVVGTGGGSARLDGDKFEAATQGPPYGVYGIIQDNEGRYWLSGGGGVWRFDPASQEWREFSSQTGDLPVYNIFGSARDADGNLYFASEGGLIRYDGNEVAVWVVPNVPTFGSFGRVLPAPDGKILFTEEYGSHTDQFNPSDEQWSAFGLPCEYCAPMAFDADGKLWAGGDQGLWIVNGNDLTNMTTEHGLPSNLVTSIAFASDGHIWIGTDAGVAHLEGETVTALFNADTAGITDNNIYALLAASDGSMWVGHETGLSRMLPDGSWVHYTADDPFAGQVRVSDLAEDAGGAIWVTTLGKGVYRLAGDEWKHFDPNDPGVKLPSTEVNSVTVAPDGSLWFGTYYSGAARFDGSEWEAFDVRPDSGLINWNVNDIYVDGSGAAWFATSGGVTRYAP